MIRAYRPGDETGVADLWWRAGRVAYPYLPTWQAFGAEEARRVFRDVIAANDEVWVAEQDARIVGYLALDGSILDRLYVDPQDQRRGIGTKLLRHALRLRPEGLSLCTHLENLPARALYEKHGFRVVRFGVSPPPESAPDVEYAWRPPGAGED